LRGLEPDSGFLSYAFTDLPVDDWLQVWASLIPGRWSADEENLQFVVDGTDVPVATVTLSVEDSAATIDFELTLQAPD
jgi:hypothetical protein